MITKMPYRYAFLLISLLMVSCSPEFSHQQPTATTVTFSSPVTTFVSSRTMMTTETPTPTQELNITGLPGGAYLIYTYENALNNSSDSPVIYEVDMQSLNGVNSRTLYQATYTYNSSFYKEALLSSNQDHLIIFDYDQTTPTPEITNAVMFNLHTGKPEKVPPFPLGCLYLSLAPDAESWVGQCGSGGTAELYYKNDKTSDQSAMITNCLAVNDQCESPQWSPDGKWLSYYRRQVPVGGGYNREDGVMLMSSNCVLQPSGCNHAPGVSDGWPDYAWSPDSQFIATSFIPGHDPIFIYKVVNGTLVQYKVIPQITGTFIGQAIVWSPDGQSLAFSDGGADIYIVDVKNGNYKLLVQRDSKVDVLGMVQLGDGMTP